MPRNFVELRCVPAYVRWSTKRGWGERRACDVKLYYLFIFVSRELLE